MSTYDYIIAGMGASGLGLALHINQSPKLRGRKTLLIDRQPKNSNDRTWCFWSTEIDPVIKDCISQSWDKLSVKTPERDLELDLGNYRYHLIRGIDFYAHALAELGKNPNIEIRYDPVVSLNTLGNKGVVKTEKSTFEASRVFSSIFEKPDTVMLNGKIYLLQHFVGWKVKTDSPVFNPNIPDFMDFRTPQIDCPTFFYVIPYSDKEALVEYTLFSRDAKEPEFYETAIRNYLIKRYSVTKFEIMEKESGAIPMTDHVFSAGEGAVINIGTAGGLSKPSSGYTFYRSLKHSKAIVECLEADKDPLLASLYSVWKMKLDSMMLHVMNNDGASSWRVFQSLFENNPVPRALSFLNDETSVGEDLLVMASVPSIPFLKVVGKSFGFSFS